MKITEKADSVFVFNSVSPFLLLILSCPRSASLFSGVPRWAVNLDDHFARTSISVEYN